MNQQIIKDINTKIAAYLGLTSDKLGFYSANDFRKVGVPFPQYMGNGTNELKFHSSLDWLNPVINKIERETGYINVTNQVGKHNPDLNGSNLYDSVFIKKGGDLKDVYVAGIGNNRIEAIFCTIGEFLDKYDSQEEKNNRIEENQEAITHEIEIELALIWQKTGIDRPTNHFDIIDYIYDDICDIDEEVNSGTVATGLRRWIESQQK